MLDQKHHQVLTEHWEMEKGDIQGQVQMKLFAIMYKQGYFQLCTIPNNVFMP